MDFVDELRKQALDLAFAHAAFLSARAEGGLVSRAVGGLVSRAEGGLVSREGGGSGGFSSKGLDLAFAHAAFLSAVCVV